MSTQTVRTLKLSREDEQKLYNAWREYEAKTPPYARFQLRPENCVITCYESGKTVFQGKDAEVYASPFENGRISGSKEPDEMHDADILPQAGSDETGTGDYFGPVCVCAAIVRKEDMPLIQELGIRDSKAMSDEMIRQAAPKLMKQLTYSLLIVDNSLYNRVHGDHNMNAIKAKLHNQAYINLAKKAPLPRFRVIDQFAEEPIYYHYLRNEPEVMRSIHFETKAEDRYPAVGAASVIARYAFVRSMEQMEEKYDMTFHKGASDAVDACGREFVRKYGKERLGEVAKLHFKNTEKILKDL